jgi:hypothetical protein
MATGRFGAGYYNGFGGKVEKGETVKAGALREVCMPPPTPVRSHQPPVLTRFTVRRSTAAASPLVGTRVVAPAVTRFNGAFSWVF